VDDYRRRNDMPGDFPILFLGNKVDVAQFIHVLRNRDFMAQLPVRRHHFCAPVSAAAGAGIDAALSIFVRPIAARRMAPSYPSAPKRETTERVSARAGLSARGLTNAVGQLAPDFRFLVGDRIFFCPTFVADFLSPTISRSHIIDATVDSFVVATTMGESDFKRLLSFGYGDEKELTHKSKPILCQLTEELGTDGRDCDPLPAGRLARIDLRRVQRSSRGQDGQAGERRRAAEAADGQI
jgi:hypothetical protein